MMPLVKMAASRFRWRILQHLCTYEDFRTSSYLSSLAEDYILLLTFDKQFHYTAEDTHFVGQSPMLTEVIPIIDWEYHTKMRSFTTLHRVVCGISEVAIDVELQDSTVINDLDNKGRSALWYAVRKRMLTHVRKLLERGADPNIGDPPLWIATMRPANYEITKLLLDHGACLVIPAYKYYGWLPGIRDDRSEDSFAIDRLLICSGVNINHTSRLVDVEGVTILMRLSLSPWLRISTTLQRLQQLISFGADLEIADQEGKTAIMCAVTSTFPEAFRCLAGAGARLDQKTVKGSTILHLAIFRTSGAYKHNRVKELCKAMHDTDLTSVDLDAKDENGNTAYDLLRIRNGPDWRGYCQNKDRRPWYDYKDWLDDPQAIKVLEKLLHHVQESQGIPEADRYPPLGEYGSRDPEDPVVPGEWPAYGD